MEDNKYAFLPYFLTEPLYIVEDRPKSDFGEETLEYDQSIEAGAGSLDHNKSIKLTWEGGFKKNIVILIRQNELQYLDETQQSLLIKILKAVNCDMQDIALVNLAHYEQKLKVDDLIAIKAHYLVAFGIEYTDVDWERNLVMDQVIEQNGIKILFTSSFDALQNERDKKVSLWNNLKNMFSV